MAGAIVDKDTGWLAFIKRMRDVRNSYVKVGVLAESNKGSADRGGGLTTAELAAILEFGTRDGRIPSRPAFRMTFDTKLEDIRALTEKLAAAVLVGNMSVKQALGVLGAFVATEIKKTITEGAGVPPPNAPSTIEQKGSDRPWVDTGRTANAITWSVKIGGEKDSDGGEE